MVNSVVRYSIYFSTFFPLTSEFLSCRTELIKMSKAAVSNRKIQQDLDAINKEANRSSNDRVVRNLQWVGLFITIYLLAPAYLVTLSTAVTKSSTKPFDTFEEFYPFYISQHADETCRRLHFIGTSIIFLYAMVESALFPSLILGGLMGEITFHATRGIEHGFIEMAAMFLTFIFSVRVFTGSLKKGALVLLVAYGFAWVGHFVYEHNKPATFIYPLFSLLGDFKMWSEIATGQRAF